MYQIRVSPRTSKGVLAFRRTARASLGDAPFVYVLRRGERRPEPHGKARANVCHVKVAALEPSSGLYLNSKHCSCRMVAIGFKVYFGTSGGLQIKLIDYKLLFDLLKPSTLAEMNGEKATNQNGFYETESRDRAERETQPRLGPLVRLKNKQRCLRRWSCSLAHPRLGTVCSPPTLPIPWHSWQRALAHGARIFLQSTFF